MIPPNFTQYIEQLKDRYKLDPLLILDGERGPLKIWPCQVIRFAPGDNELLFSSAIGEELAAMLVDTGFEFKEREDIVRDHYHFKKEEYDEKFGRQHYALYNGITGFDITSLKEPVVRPIYHTKYGFTFDKGTRQVGQMVVRSESFFHSYKRNANGGDDETVRKMLQTYVDNAQVVLRPRFNETGQEIDSITIGELMERYRFARPSYWDRMFADEMVMIFEHLAKQNGQFVFQHLKTYPIIAAHNIVFEDC
ncbi:hypothetical protein HYV86_01110 [Candidatus Woesearchaeota archaeon]|nr:hypothetical protein [Candidatus Woesearchaeota archaeon]